MKMWSILLNHLKNVCSFELRVTDTYKDKLYMKKWNELPKVMQNDKVKYYYDILLKHEKELKLKRVI